MLWALTVEKWEKYQYFWIEKRALTSAVQSA